MTPMKVLVEKGATWYLSRETEGVWEATRSDWNWDCSPSFSWVFDRLEAITSRLEAIALDIPAHKCLRILPRC